MAALRLGTAHRTAMADVIGTLADAGPAGGRIELRNGTMPATPQTAVTGTLLATVTLQDPSTSAATAGVETILDPASVTGVAAGDITWARLTDSTGANPVDMDVTANGGGGTLTMSTVTVSVGLTIDYGAITVNVPQGL